MSKAILVMDMPECCIDCPCSHFERGTPKLNLVCGLTQEDANNIGKPEWCPLRELLQKDKSFTRNKEYHYQCGWIPCSERLPEKDVWCLATFESGNVDKIQYLSTNNWGWNGEIGDNRVIAWQPLPEPYQKGE